MKIKIIYIIYGICLLLNLVLGILLYYLFSQTYEIISFQIISFYQKTDKLDLFRKQYFSFQNFQILRYFILSIFFLNLGAWFYLPKITNYCQQKLQNILNKLKSLFHHILILLNGLSFQEKILSISLITFFTLFKLYQLLYFPPLLDEVFTYIYLVNKGFLVSASYYPGPNNHILLSLFACFVFQLSPYEWLEPIFALRLVSLLAFILNSIFLGLYLLKKYNFYWAFWGVLAWGSLSPVSLFAILGRGYMLETLWVMGLIWAIFASRKIFITISIAGFYTIPTFLYPFLSVVVFQIFQIIKQNKLQKLIQTFKTYAWIFGFTFLLYLPIILFNGVEALGANNWVKPLNINDFNKQLSNYFLSVADFFFPDFGFLLFSVFILFFIHLLIKPKENSALSYLLLSFWLSPILILLIQRVLPPERTWTYFSLIVILSILQLIKNKISHKIMFAGFGIFLLVWQIKDFQFHYKSPDYQLFAQRVRQEKFQQIFVNEDTYQVFLRYEYLKEKQAVQIENQHFTPNIPFQLIVLAKQSTQSISIESSKYTRYYEDNVIIAYKINTHSNSK